MFTFLAMLCVLFVSTNSLDFLFYDISSDLLIDNCSKLHAILYRSSINIVKGYPGNSIIWGFYNRVLVYHNMCECGCTISELIVRN